jgi:ABC-type Fe3+/spermidine/putrescine transport system ATPase subunit
MVMLDGRSVEHGTPREVYELPRDPFSARFVGGANMLRGKAVGTEGDLVKVRLDDGGALVDVPARSRGEPVEAGKAVWVAVRPETISIAGGDVGERANLVQGAVESVTYFGAYSDVFVRIGETLVNARVDPGQALQAEVGQPIRLALLLNSLVALPAS